MSSITITIFSLILSFSIMASPEAAAAVQDLHQLKETKMSIFFQDTATGPNASLAAVAGIPGKRWDFLEFGTVFVTDDPITESIEKDSKEIARGQGIYVTSSLNGGSTHVLISIAFTDKEYNGSTLEIQGRSLQLAKVREVSIVSGTGKFRFARGYATFETVYFDPSIIYSAIRCNVTVLH